ncbi:RNA polymerase sigma factor [Baekduia alba]|uniref:RNA polymerase sigma factor n=1 Tax=Baekduia alba TaxID=2997333 RepID=UPI00233FAC2C|nr:sigma-70 family RNA polymerase sigma factor [Baekduia alba]WCB94283.1 RNA polymerase sigma factor [Baekduia alba]
MKLDATSLGDLFEAEGPRLLAFVTRSTFDADQALDVVGEVFAVAFERRAKFRGATREEAVAWLYWICRTQLNHQFRRRGAERRALGRLGVDRPVMGEDERRRVEELAGLAELRAVVASELERLPADQREAVRLRVVDELGYDELADRLGITQQTARARVSRGLRALGEAVKVMEEVPDAR